MNVVDALHMPGWMSGFIKDHPKLVQGVKITVAAGSIGVGSYNGVHSYLNSDGHPTLWQATTGTASLVGAGYRVYKAGPGHQSNAVEAFTAKINRNVTHLLGTYDGIAGVLSGVALVGGVGTAFAVNAIDPPNPACTPKGGLF